MLAHSAELFQGCSNCGECGIANCSTTPTGIRTMQFHQFDREKHEPIVQLDTIGCPWIVLAPPTGNIVSPKELKTLEEFRLREFIRYLYLVGEIRVANYYLEQITAGVQPKDIVLPTSEQFAYPEFSDASTIGEKNKLLGIKTKERGESSEKRLFELLGNQNLFPWITQVVIAEPGQPKFDCTILIDDSHPIGKMLGTSSIYIDAKSSIKLVERYYHDKTRSQAAGARKSLVRKKSLWAINSQEDLSDQEIIAQLVTYILIATNKFNQPLLWEQVLAHLTKEVRDAFEAERSIVYQVGKIIMQTLLSPQTMNTLQPNTDLAQLAIAA